MNPNPDPESSTPAARSRLKVVFCWHMHQPQYADGRGGDYQLPWTYLHAIKDYVDMAAHLEDQDGACAVVNFVPTLLEQIDDYAAMLAAWLENGARIRDPLLAALAGPGVPTDPAARVAMVEACLRANETHMIERFAPYARLVKLARYALEHEYLDALNDGFMADLLVWYHLAWMGETVRRTDPRVEVLQDKGAGFDAADRRTLITVIQELIVGIVPRYRELARAGRVELSVTPFAHPIGPLLLDIQSARDAWPEVDLGGLESFPGGGERLDWHVREGVRYFQTHFGVVPTGCWPAEGSVCDGTLSHLAGHGLRWAATGEGVLRNTLARAHGDPEKDGDRTWLFQPYRPADADIACFFRDDGLSDRIGFTYSTWHSDDAVGDLIHHLGNIAEALDEPGEHVVSIIMDGENAWDHYPENGYHFLSQLYRRVAAHPALELTTFQGALDGGVRVGDLPPLVAGSWVYGSFSTWIGDKDKNRGWELLIEAKKAFDAHVDALEERPADHWQLEHQMALCEGSDWFWWFGDYNPADTVRDFDGLYRHHLRDLYTLMGETPPDVLNRPFAHGGGDPALGGVMKRGHE
ncbi:MAG: glycoside hydrolase [Gammaproteobacteria bacterium]